MPEQRSTRTSTPSEGARARGSSADAGRGTVTQVGPEEAARSAYAWLDSSIVHLIEGVCAVRRTEHGWCVAVDVLEVPRIPDTTSLLATYEVELDETGRPAEYRRIRRYQRGAADG
ncbi:gas vesicle protein [Streptomyces sp. NPDC047985]|uniref:gas vesicle protein GvpO n=1 Tax=unclassified Streptomyces TaxID=2593676 RepID=UPI00343003EC